MHVCMHAGTCACMYVFTYICMFVCNVSLKYVCMCVYNYGRMYLCTHLCMYTHYVVCILVQIYILEQDACIYSRACARPNLHILHGSRRVPSWSNPMSIERVWQTIKVTQAKKKTMPAKTVHEDSQSLCRWDLFFPCRSHDR
jgi:hypothetical protein